MSITHEVKILITWDRYQEIKKYVQNKGYDSVSSFIRRCIYLEMTRNPLGPGKPKKNKNVKISD